VRAPESGSPSSAYGDNLRALVKYLDDVSDVDIVFTNIPTGTPSVYDLTDSLKPERYHYLGEGEEVRSGKEAVPRQGEAKQS